MEHVGTESLYIRSAVKKALPRFYQILPQSSLPNCHWEQSVLLSYSAISRWQDLNQFCLNINASKLSESFVFQLSTLAFHSLWGVLLYTMVTSLVFPIW